MPTVLLISYTGLIGGAERALLTFAQSLDGERWLACPDGPLAQAGRITACASLPCDAGRRAGRETCEPG